MEGNADIGLMLKRINMLMINDFDKHLKKYNLTFSQMQLLEFLRQNGGSQPQKAIEKHFNIAHTSVINLLQRIEKKGFISVMVDPNDRRCRIVTLTENISGYFKGASDIHNELEKRLTECFSDDELETLRNYLDRMHLNLLKGKECSYDYND